MILHFTRRTLQPGVTVLAMKGSIHVGPECARLEREVKEMIAAGETKVVFDMAEVTFADSAAIGAMVRCFTQLSNAGGGLRIAAPQSMIDYSLKLTKVDRFLPIFATAEEAAASFGAA